jgi:hypothetical protein
MFERSSQMKIIEQLFYNALRELASISQQILCN